jgi:hypothetical protein
VGAAFDFHAGTVRRAPAWMRDNGLEWLHRLLSEPGRLWKRYLVTNTLFIVGRRGSCWGSESQGSRYKGQVCRLGLTLLCIASCKIYPYQYISSNEANPISWQFAQKPAGFS